VLLNVDWETWFNSAKHVNASTLDVAALTALPFAQHAQGNASTVLRLLPQSSFASALSLSANRTSAVVGAFVCLYEAAYYTVGIAEGRGVDLGHASACAGWPWPWNQDGLDGQDGQPSTSATHDMRTHSSNSTPSSSACDWLQDTLNTLHLVHDEWRLTDSLLGTYFEISAPDPSLNQRPSFFRAAGHDDPEYPRSHSDWQFAFRENATAACNW